MLTISLVTLGDPDTLTGGYLYHRRVADAAAEHDARVVFVSFPDRLFPLPAASGRAVLRRAARADVIVLDSIAAAFLAPWLVAPPRPVVAMLHQPPGGIDHGPVRTRVQALLDRAAYRRAARLLVASHALARDVAGAGLPAQRIRVVPPGRDVAAAPEPPPRDLRAGRRAAFLSVGNWVPRKGVLPLLDAFARLPADAATLHLVGRTGVDPDYERRVRSRLSDADLRERVIVHGPVGKERVAALYAAADAFVLASSAEPYGTVYGEAMAAGLPVVGWDAGNLPWLARHEQDGLVVAEGDLARLAAALRRLADDPALRTRLGASARARAQTFPTWEETARLFFTEVRAVAR